MLHGKMYQVANGPLEDAIVGSSNFTLRGFGLSPSFSNIELNLEVDSNRDRRDLKNWFNEIWDSDLVEDVKDEVLLYLEQLYKCYKELRSFLSVVNPSLLNAAQHFGGTSAEEIGVNQAGKF